MIKRNFKILKVDHIAIATLSSEKMNYFLENVIGLECVLEEKIESEKVKVSKFSLKNLNIEVLNPISKDSPISNYLKKQKTGVHHICLLVDNIKEAILYFKSNKIGVIYDTPRLGAMGKLVTFLNPKDTNGILIEISQNSLS
ncbi:MAG: methylmalonyl-CoA epimerase [Candidatus Marinimicrobia bacterium]|nr:methylmalonyl-CoA epimerase [Candidatus Neomarinimicrobiota bacterium]|tara:strand:+ start:123 stop:548 length:426 start_codon:yes stop_codon:yes gene_type:complete